VTQSPFIEYHDSVAGPSASGLTSAIYRAFRPASIVEVGSVSDLYLNRFLKLGVDAYGTRPAHFGPPTPLTRERRVLITDPVTPNPFGFTFDVAIALEVADKLEPDQAASFVRELSAYADRVVFSAARPGQGGFHLNPQPLSYWVKIFWENGFELHLPSTLWMRRQWMLARAPEWLPRNVAVFQRSSIAPEVVAESMAHAGRIVGTYDRLELRLLFDEAARVPADQAVVEVGTYLGRNTAALALGAGAGQGCTVWAVDHHQGDPETAREACTDLEEMRTWPLFAATLRQLRLTDRVVPVLADAMEAAATWTGPPVGLLVLDGETDERGLENDLDAWIPHLAPQALVAFGGVDRHDSVRRVLEKMTRRGIATHHMRVGALGFARTEAGSDTGPRPGGRRSRTWHVPRRDRISIIMPTRNEGPFLRATVDSLLANTFYPDFELIVLDDASHDGSTDFLLSPSYYRDSRITLIRKRKQHGYLHLWREGVEQASGSVLKFLDAHHCFAPYWLTALYETLKRHRFRAIVGPVVTGLDPESWSMTHGTGLFGYTFDGDFARIRCLTRENQGPGGRVPWLCGHQMMLSRATYDAVGGFFPFFQGHGTDDSDLCMRAFLLGFDCHVEPSSVIAHHHKQRHINPVTHADVGFNTLMSVYLNLGEERFEAFYQAHKNDIGFREGRERMRTRRSELECFRDWIVRRQSRTPEELLENLAHY